MQRRKQINKARARYRKKVSREKKLSMMLMPVLSKRYSLDAKDFNNFMKLYTEYKLLKENHENFKKGSIPDALKSLEKLPLKSLYELSNPDRNLTAADLSKYLREKENELITKGEKVIEKRQSISSFNFWDRGIKVSKEEYKIIKESLEQLKQEEVRLATGIVTEIKFTNAVRELFFESITNLKYR